MRLLTEKGTQDAAAVKVLTVITLVYLPATVVCVSTTPCQPSTELLMFTNFQSFFSTQFVSQQQASGGGTILVIAANAWLFAAIAVPLTLGTLGTWWVWVRFQRRSHSSRARGEHTFIDTLKKLLKSSRTREQALTARA